MTDLALNTTNGDGPGGGTVIGEHFTQHLCFHNIPNGRRRAMAFNVINRRGWNTGVIVGSLNRLPLTTRVRCCDALPFAIRCGANATDHSQNIGTILLGIRQPAEHKDCGSLTHNKTVGTGVKGPRSIRAQGSDLGKLYVGLRSHIGVHTTHHSVIVLVRAQSKDGSVQSRQRSCAGGIGCITGTRQVKRAGHAARDAVGQLAGHGVFGDRHQVVSHGGVHIAHQLLLDGSIQLLEAPCAVHSRRELVQVTTKRSLVHLLAAHRVAKNNGRTTSIKVALSQASVGQGLSGREQSPLLNRVDNVAHLGRNTKFDRLERGPFHETTNARIGLVQNGAVLRIVV